MSGGDLNGKHDNSEKMLRSIIQAGAKVLGTMRRLPERRRVLGEARGCWSSAGAEEDDGGGMALRGEGDWNKMEPSEWLG